MTSDLPTLNNPNTLTLQQLRDQVVELLKTQSPYMPTNIVRMVVPNTTMFRSLVVHTTIL